MTGIFARSRRGDLRHQHARIGARLEHDGETVARRQRHRSRRRVSQSARVQNRAVGQIFGDIPSRVDFGLGQKPRMAGSEKALEPFGSSDHAALDQWPDRRQSEISRADETVNLTSGNI